MAASGSEDETDGLRESQAYNENIYLMVAAPYVLLGALGFLVYRSVKKAQRARPLPEGLPPPGQTAPV